MSAASPREPDVTPRDAIANMAMEFRYLAESVHLNGIQRGRPVYYADWIHWGSRLERAVRMLDAEKRGAVPPAAQDTPLCNQANDALRTLEDENASQRP